MGTYCDCWRYYRGPRRSKHDRLAYAVHAFLLADGYKLVATGKDADVPSAGAGRLEFLLCSMRSKNVLLTRRWQGICLAEIAQESPEVGMEGWTDLPDAYAFRYVDTTGKVSVLLVVCSLSWEHAQDAVHWL